MEKEILLLATPANTGKTTAINSLYEKFINIKHYDLKDERDYTTSLKNKSNDFLAVHTVKDNIVGFVSMGDRIGDIADNGKYFEDNKCNICITACRRGGKEGDNFYKYVEEWAMKNAYDISFFDFGSCRDGNEDNKNKAHTMLSRLQYLLKN